MATYLHFNIYLAFKSKFNLFISLSPEKKLKREAITTEYVFKGVGGHFIDAVKCNKFLLEMFHVSSERLIKKP